MTDMALTTEEQDSALEEIASEIRAHCASAVEEMLDVGRYLCEAKKLVGHGRFLEWVQREFAWTPRQAQRLMLVHERFPNAHLVQENLGPSALQLLAGGSVPEEAVEEVFARAEDGERLTYREVSDTIKRHKGEGGAPPSVAEVFDRALAGGDEEALEPDDVLDPDEDDLDHVEVQTRADAAKAAASEPSYLTTPGHPRGVPGGVVPKEERYSPAELVEPARKLMGGITLDPATSLLANRTVKAARIYTAAEDGLSQVWLDSAANKTKVWLNPPYRQGEGGERDWMRKLLEEYERGHVLEACALISHDPSRAWFIDDGWDMRAARCEVRGRLSFTNPFPDQREDGARFASVVIYLGHNVLGFAQAYAPHGRIVVPPAAAGIPTGAVIPFGASVPNLLPSGLRRAHQASMFGAQGQRQEGAVER